MSLKVNGLPCCISLADCLNEAGAVENHAGDELDEVCAGRKLSHRIVGRANAGDTDDGEARAVLGARLLNQLVGARKGWRTRESTAKFFRGVFWIFKLVITF